MRRIEIAPPVGHTRRVSVGGRVLHGPWPRREAARVGEESCATEDPTATQEGRFAGNDEPPALSGKIMLGFIVRDCAVALGHSPSPEELAAWANHQSDERGEYCLFGRRITVGEARVMLKHLARPVTVRPERLRPRTNAGERSSL
jgi:hypothetical protein